MTSRAVPFIILGAFFFGSTLVASRFVVGEIQPVPYLAIRGIIASLVFAGFYATSTTRAFPRGKKLWLHGTFMGIYGTALNSITIVMSLLYLSAGTTSVLMTLIPVGTITLAQIFLPDERLTPRQWLGIALAFGGAVMLAIAGENGLPDVADADPRGYILIGISVLSVSTSSIYARHYLQDYSSTDIASIRIYTSTLVLIPLAIIFFDVDFSSISRSAIFATLYAALSGTLGGFFTQLFIIQRFGAVPSAIINYTMPIIAGLGGVIILGETLTTVLVFGFIIIITGIVLTQHNPKVIVPTTS